VTTVKMPARCMTQQRPLIQSKIRSGRAAALCARCATRTPAASSAASLCARSGHSLSTTARISSEMASTPSMSSNVLVQPLQVGLEHDLAADDAGLIDAALLLYGTLLRPIRHRQVL
jgi:hypothetical protein